MHFQRTLGAPSDTLAGSWLPTTDLYTYLGGDSTVFYWHGTEYLAVPARIAGYATTHEFLAAYDDSTWAIDINEIRWNASPPSPFYADFVIAYPSLAAVDGSGTSPHSDAVRLLLLGQRVGTSEARIAVDLPAPTKTSVRILDVQGRHVRTLHDGLLPAGRSTASWDGCGEGGARVQSGVYFVHLQCGRQNRVARVLVLR